MRLVSLAIENSPHSIDIEYIRLGAHESPDRLRELIQEKIYEADEKGGYDAVILGYGLCGNAAAGLKAGKIPLVIPRAHDCCTVYLGSKEKFIEHFRDNLSSSWSCVGYMEHESSYLRETDTGRLLGLDKDYEQLVEQYGEENARYIWETLHPKSHNDELFFIDVPELAHLGYLEKFVSFSQEQGKKVRVLPGDMRLIRMLVNGDWKEDEFLVVLPGKEIKAVYDQDKILDV